MEIKEINNQSNQLLTNKKGSQGALGGLDFSSLVQSQKSNFGAISNDTGFAQKAEKTHPSEKAQAQQPETIKRRSPQRETPVEEKVEEPRRKTKVETKEEADATYVEPTAQKETSNTQKELDNNSNSEENATLSADKNQTEVGENNVTSEQNDDSEVALNSEKGKIATQGESETLENIATVSNIKMSALSGNAMFSGEPVQNLTMVQASDVVDLGEIIYQDPQTGMMVYTTGEQLAKDLMTGKVNNLQPEQILNPDQTPALTIQTDINNSVDGKKLQGTQAVSEQQIYQSEEQKGMVDENVKSTKKQAKTMTTSSQINNIEHIDSEETVIPAEDIEDFAKEQKISLDVKVAHKEENFSYKARQEMISENMPLQQTLDSVEDATIQSEGEENVQVLSDHLKPAQTKADNMKNDMLTPMAVAQNVAEVSMAKAAEVATTSSEVNVVSAVTNDSGALRQTKNVQMASLKTTMEENLKNLNQEVIDQVKVNITKSAVKGVDKIDIRLKPEDLGHIEIKMELAKDGKLQAHLIASRPETMEILQKDVQSLQKAFADAGFQLDDQSLSFSFQDNGSAWQQKETEQEMRQFMGRLFENDNENDNLPLAEASWDGQSALNIRV